MAKEILIKFAQWTKLKFKLQTGKNIDFYFREREIWWASIGANIGFEEEGKNEKFERPVLVLKKFGKEMLWALPLTSQDKTGKFYYQFEYEGKKYSIILSQLRTISSKRLSRKVRTLKEDDFMKIKKLMKEFL